MRNTTANLTSSNKANILHGKTMIDLTHPNYKSFSLKINIINMAICNPKEETTSATNSIISQPIKVQGHKKSGGI